MSARARIHAMFPLDEAAEAELDTRLDAHRAEVLAEDGQAYNGELAMLRGLVATLNAIAGQDDLAGVQKLLWEYARDDAAARVQAPTGFFRPGHVYAREHHGDTIRFLVRAVSWAPDHSYRVAFGWRIDEDGDWEPTDSDDMDGWTDVTGEAMP